MRYVNRKCLYCKKQFTIPIGEFNRGWGKFCSNSCSTKYNNAGIGKKSNTQCSFCKAKLYRRRKGCRFYTCNKIQCKRKRQSINTKEQYQRNSKKRPSSEMIWRNNIRKSYGNKCEICNWAKSSCDIHHITSVKAGGSNNIDNLIVLCPNHHRLADKIKTQTRAQLIHILMGPNWKSTDKQAPK